MVIAVALLCGVHWYRTKSAEVIKPTDTTTASSQPQRSTFVEPPVLQPSTQRRAAPQPLATVYECRPGGQRILSSTPCGPHAQPLAIQQPNRMDAQDTSRLYEPSSPSRTAPPSSRPMMTERGTATRCAVIEREIDRINALMRQGYRNAEGYRQRLRQLSDERWDLECRWLNTPESSR